MARSDTFVLARWVRVAFATPQERSHFFGYYNQSPLSADGRHMLAHRLSVEGGKVEASDQAKVGLFDVSALVGHIQTVHGDPELREPMAQALLARALEEFRICGINPNAAPSWTRSCAIPPEPACAPP
jgi:hypothetical protein